MVRVWDLKEASQIEDKLIALWQEAFFDSESYIKNFISSSDTNTKVVAYVCDGDVVSATYLLPISYIQDDNTRIDCYYLYAATTQKAHRGKGYFARILDFVNEHIDKPIILVPASESLVEYYKGHGFYVWLTEKQEAVAKLQNAKGTPVSKTEYLRFRKEVFHKPQMMCWDDKMLDYILSEHEKAGGIFVATFIEGAHALIMRMGAEIDCNIVEVVCDDDRLKIQPTVMANNALFSKGKGYFNLTMG